MLARFAAVYIGREDEAGTVLSADLIQADLPMTGVRTETNIES
jgi:hypothetical protein